MDSSYLRALKVFVVVAGLVLVLGTAALAWLLIRRHDQEAARPARVPAMVDLPLPAGARIEQVVADGPRLLLLLRGPEEQQYLALVNPATGERLGLIRLVPERP
jgi:hypothetical protein